MADTYAYEEAEEKKAMLKNLHAPMKKWYIHANCRSIQDKYGLFPQFWQDLGSWPHYKIVLKLYLYVSDRGIHDKILDVAVLEELVSAKPAMVPAAEEVGQIVPPGIDAEQQANLDEEKRRKRRNRWGVGPGDTPASLSETTVGGVATDNPSSASLIDTVHESVAPPPAASSLQTTEDEDATRRRKKSRWSANADPTSNTQSAPVLAPAQPVPFVIPHELIQQTVVLQMQLMQINDSLATVVQDALLREIDPNRSPSPPPRYDGMGKRTNTREMRMRESLTNDRIRIIEDLIKINPLYQPPADFVKAKPHRKVYIPLKENPNYNFIGLIIGPRGNTQKRMEKETNTKISIRGKGSVKEGSKGRNAGKNQDEDDELHVHIQGETDESVIAAVKLVEELLVPVDDEKNEHKQKQLRELALINGTLREDEFCQVCGERGHRQYECPQRSKTFKAANVKCAICGDQSHPTRDCPQKESGPTNELVLDSQYNDFLAEIGDEKSGVSKATDGIKPEPVAEIPPEITTEVSVDGNVTVTEKVVMGSKKQTIIQSNAVLTGWGMQAAVPTYGYGAPAAPWMLSGGQATMNYGAAPVNYSQGYMPPAGSMMYSGSAYSQNYGSGAPPPPPPPVPPPPTAAFDQTAMMYGSYQQQQYYDPSVYGNHGYYELPNNVIPEQQYSVDAYYDTNQLPVPAEFVPPPPPISHQPPNYSNGASLGDINEIDMD